MKKILFLISAAALLGGAAACSKQGGTESSGARLSLSWDTAAGTKGAASPAEKQVNSLVFYVFDQNGMLDVSHTCSSTELAEKKAVIRLKTGGKTVWAVANLTGAPLAAANACTTRGDLEAVAFSLAANAKDSFVMTASADVNLVASGTPPCNLQLTRPVAKVSLGTVTNRLPASYGGVTLQRAFLCNVVGNQDIAGTAEADPSAWINPEGTPDRGGKGHTIGQGGFTAQVPDLTYRELGDDVPSGGSKAYAVTGEGGKYFYAFANGLTNPNNGYTNPFSPTATVLMLVVRVRNVEYYYPVALKNGLARNTDNVVNITLTGLGNTLEDGPFNKIEKADLTAVVTVSDWRDGSTYTETI